MKDAVSTLRILKLGPGEKQSNILVTLLKKQKLVRDI